MDKDNSVNCNVLAIGRAERYSPNSVDKDAAVLESVCCILRSKEMAVTTVSEDVFLALDGKDNGKYDSYDIYVSMGRHVETLRFLEQQRNRGAVVVNDPMGVSMCCNRKRLYDTMLERGVPVPPSDGEHGYWLKRACGSTERKNDVRYAATRQEMEQVKREMEAGGTGEVLVQAHVEGDLVKFYGVIGENFFKFYYPGDDRQWKFGDEQRNGKPQHYKFDVSKLAADTVYTAVIAAVDVYGGDAIVRADGSFVIIDFNDWPSFSRCREEAAEVIAAHIIHIYNGVENEHV